MASASVIGQRPNFTIADYSASADCENCSFGHCLVLFSCPIIIFCSKYVMSCIVLYVSFLEFEFLKVKRCLINEIVSTLIFSFWHNFISECNVCGTRILTSDIETSKILFSPGYRKSFYLDFSWGVLRSRINWD